jgi:lipoprotein-anchoring transpeptidase ErfK/SrfK
LKMNFFKSLVVWSLISVNLLTTPLPATGAPTADTEPAAGEVVCAPGIYKIAPDDCLPAGPSAEIARLLEQGIPYPILPLPAYAPDPALHDIPYRYFKVTEQGTPLFLSLEDGINNRPSRYIEPGFIYVSYETLVDTEQGGFYRLRDGSWIRAEGARAAIPVFQGLLFSSTPRHAFGWVLGQTTSYRAPGYGEEETGKVYYRYEIVPIYGIQEAEENTWLLIGSDEWLDYRQVARVEPRSTPPDGVPVDRWIEVNLDEQTLAVYDHNQLVFATIVSTGIEPFWTRPGLFQIYEKKAIETMSGATTADRSDYYYLQDVPWTMYFDQKRALHGEYWHTSLGYPRSHGCVNLSIGDAHWLFEWATVGDYVYVYDPSGRTPTDPSLYGAGSP